MEFCKENETKHRMPLFLTVIALNTEPQHIFVKANSFPRGHLSLKAQMLSLKANNLHSLGFSLSCTEVQTGSEKSKICSGEGRGGGGG